jgi:hypothetical protein
MSSGKIAHQVLDDMSRRHSGRAARRRCSVRVSFVQTSPTGWCSRRSSALGCTGRTGAHVRGLARGERRVDPVAGLDVTTAGASRRLASHLQTYTSRSPAQTYVPRASAASTGQKRPVISVRRGCVPGGSAGQWPSMELAGRGRAKMRA